MFRLLNNLILWRLLYPEAFGVMAIVNVCLVGLAMFSDIGIGPSIIQHERGDDPTYLNTAWTIQIVRELILCLVSLAIAAPIAAFYKEPLLVYLIPAASISGVLVGFNSTRLFSAARKISLGRLTGIDLLSQIGGLAVTIVWAWLARSIWALVAGSTVSAAIRMILSHTFLPGIRNRFCWDPTCARILLRFGRWIFLSTLLTFLAGQSDRLIFGKLIPMGMLGVYSIATTWAALPQTVILRVFGAVLFPLLSRLHHEGNEFLVFLRKTRKQWLLLAGYISACLLSGGPTLIRLLYESKATNAGWIIQVLAVGVWFVTLEAANGTALLAIGHPKWLAAGNAAKLVGMVALIPIGYSAYAFPGAVAGLASTEVLHYLTTLVGARRHKVACLGQDMILSALVLLTSSVGLLVARWLGPLVQSAAFHPARLGALLEGLAIAICVGAGWACAFGWDRMKRKRQLPAY